jgi:hypothetical protein
MTPCIAVQVSQGAAGSGLIPLAAGAAPSLADQSAEAGEVAAWNHNIWVLTGSAALCSVLATACAPAAGQLHDYVT